MHLRHVGEVGPRAPPHELLDELVELRRAEHPRLMRSLKVQLEVIERVERAGGRSTRSTTAG
jgi:hypothetical protein